MEKDIYGDMKILHAEEGFLLTNGSVYGKTVYLPWGADEEEWYETEDNGIEN